MTRLGMEEGQPIEHSLITGPLKTLRKESRATTSKSASIFLEYDDVMNKQREVIYGLRKRVLAREGVPEEIQETIEDLAEGLVESVADVKTYPEEWEYQRLNDRSCASLPSSRGPLGRDRRDDRERLLEKS